ncbi:hypothetical protein PC9H_008378 [Pleurotus ostreatus]|uniref:Uncharacterized protein n=1 Tax=Pleurotus ostreatus TaxID=5322 RepID=A0A8H7DQ75_PLEOS|nr:uncharacterized protein PC9H_008378 [Pleurotus ostreatus]KAF7426015.1 hypothetical protein PC9H_008378 [Pleurotus ostreatus]
MEKSRLTTIERRSEIERRGKNYMTIYYSVQREETGDRGEIGRSRASPNRPPIFLLDFHHRARTEQTYAAQMVSLTLLCKLTTQRQLVVQDHPEISVVSLEFFQTVTPAVPDAMLNAVLERLKEHGSITNNGRMWGLEDPKQSGRPENDTFTHVHEFTEAIIRAGEGYTGQESCMTMGHSPNSTLSKALQNQRRGYETLFSPIIAIDKERRNALANEDLRFISSTSPPFHNMGELALRLRDMLTVSYSIAEATLPIKSDCQPFRPAFDTTAVLLRHMKMFLKKDGIAGVTSVYELLYPQKRKAKEAGDIQEEAPPMKK